MISPAADWRTIGRTQANIFSPYAWHEEWVVELLKHSTIRCV